MLHALQVGRVGKLQLQSQHCCKEQERSGCGNNNARLLLFWAVGWVNGLTTRFEVRGIMHVVSHTGRSARMKYYVHNLECETFCY